MTARDTVRMGCGFGTFAHALVSLSSARVIFVARAADVHERRKPWVPLMMEPSYRPNGWLGIMLGSRLYYEFTEAVLGDDEDWERVADSVAREVRRHGAPLPSAGPTVQAVAETGRAQEAVGDDAALAAVVAASAVRTGLAAVRPAPTREAAGGVSVSSIAHNSSNHVSNDSTTDRSVNINNNSNSNIGNIVNNTSIVLL